MARRPGNAPETSRRRAAVRLRRAVATALITSMVGTVLVMTGARPAAAAALTFVDVNPDVSDNPSRQSASGGRVNGLDIASGNNQVMYAASEFGGIYKSTNAGASWAHLTGHLPMVTWDVGVDPTNNSRVFATSFYDGRATSRAGIQRSENAGATWNKPATATPPASGSAPFTSCSTTRREEPSAFGIGIHPTNGDVYVGTNCGVARSTDGGATWTFSDPTLADAADTVWDVAVQDDGSTEGIVDICGTDGVHRSTDGGDTWTAIDGSLPGGLGFGRCTLAVSPDESYVVFVEFGGRLFETDDGGANWAEFAGSGNGGRIPFVETNDRTTGFDMWVGRGINLFRAECTTPNPAAPGGTRRCEAVSGWENAQAGAHDDTGDVIFDSGPANDRCPILYSTDGGVHTNTITGAGCHVPTWSRSNVGLHALWLYSMRGAHQPGTNNEDLYFGAQDNGAFGTTTAGAGAGSVVWTMPSCCDVFNVAADSTQVVWDRFSGYEQWHDAPGMASPTMVSTYAPGTGAQGVDLFTFPDNIDTTAAPGQYVSVSGSGAVTTTDITSNPVTWTALGTGAPASGFCGVQFAMTGATPTFYAQTGCLGVFETGGSAGPFQLWKLEGTSGSWTRVDDNFGVGGIEIFAVDRSNGDRLYASHLSGPKGVRMIFSTDGGDTWQTDDDLTRLMDGDGAFKMRPQRGALSFTGFGTYRQPTLVAFDPEDPDIVVAGGRDSGVFVSSNGGADWALLTDPYTSNTSGIPHLPRPFYAYFDHEPAGAVRVFIGTQGRGVWRADLATTDLRVTKSSSVDPVEAGTSLTYSVTASNAGSDDAANVVVVDDLPAAAQYQSVSAPGWSCDTPDVGASGAVRCTRAALGASASSVITITVNVSASTPDGTVLTNRVRIFSNAVESDSSNNSVAESTTVIARADLRVTKLDSSDPAVAGTEVDYTVTVTNDGPSRALDVVLTDMLPAGLSHVSDTGACSAGPPVSCDIGNMDPGDSKVITITANIAPDLVYNAGAPTTVTNEASVTSATGDSDPSDNNDSEDTLVEAVADLAVSSFGVVAPPPDGVIGEPVDVVVRTVIANGGPSDPMDVDLDQTAGAPPGSTVSPPASTGTVVAVAVGNPRTVDRVYTITCGSPGVQTFSFTAAISPSRPDDTDPNLSSNSAATQVELDCVVPVVINIQPKGSPNSINIKKNGVVPLAVLTTAAGEYGRPFAFDATTIDPRSVRFGAEAVVWPDAGGSAEAHGRSHHERSYELDERTRDDDLDNVLHFALAGSGLTAASTEACVKGRFQSGSNTYTFFGCDSVRMVS